MYKTDNNNEYYKINNYNTIQYIYLLIFIIILSKYFSFSIQDILIFGLALLIVIFYHNNFIIPAQLYDSNVFDQKKIFFENVLKKKELYSLILKDKELYNFLYENRTYADYNNEAYEAIIKHISNLLLLEDQSNYYLDSPYANLEVAHEEMTKALNNMHSVIYTLPSIKILNEKFTNDLDILHRILFSHYSNMKNNVRQEENSRPITNKYHDVEGNQPEANLGKLYNDPHFKFFP